MLKWYRTWTKVGLNKYALNLKVFIKKDRIEENVRSFCVIVLKEKEILEKAQRNTYAGSQSCHEEIREEHCL